MFASFKAMSLRFCSFQLAALCLVLAAGSGPRARAAEPAPTNSPALCVLTFNLRFASANPPNAWPVRRPVMRDCIRQLAPDVIGTQEGMYAQLKDLASDLPDFEWVGLGREGGSQGEFMAVFYRRDRLEPLAYDHFWLSDTPEVIASVTWGHTCKRMVTWVRFRDRRTGGEFYFWNTHLDHESEPARQKGAVLIRDRIAKLKTRLPVLLVGDFNCAGGSSPAWATLAKDGGLSDTWPLAKERVNETMNSFHGYRAPQQESLRIDWILGRGVVAVEKTEIVTFSRDGQYPSDHFPVAAWLKLEQLP
jgi:endonuclease/exonuclease/phosphatase family metal-dependent hydrolase